jgi:hypothetical protein
MRIQFLRIRLASQSAVYTATTPEPPHFWLVYPGHGVEH